MRSLESNQQGLNRGSIWTGVKLYHVRVEEDNMDMDLAYVAGLIDGEGSIQLDHRGGPSAHRAPVVSLTNTSRPIIDFLKERFGGTVCEQKRYAEHHRQAWIWRVCHDRALSFLAEVAPHLRHEQKVARAGLLLREYKSVTKRNGRYTDQELGAKRLLEEHFLAL